MSDKDKVLPDDVTGALLDAIAPVDPGPERRDRILAGLRDSISADQRGAEFVTRPSEEDTWIEAAPGNHVKILRSDSDSMSMLVRLDPGATFPAHSHPADEETYVVQGETWFGDLRLTTGDYHFAPAGSSHGEVRTETGCTLLIRKAPD